MMTKVKGPVSFEKQRLKADLLRECIKPLNDQRFKIIYDVSDWNSKYESRIGHPFSSTFRDTDIPGTVKNTNIQKNGPDQDVFIDANADYTKRSLTLGSVELDKAFYHRETVERSNQMAGKMNFKYNGEMSDPWEYCPSKLKAGTQRLSTYKNFQSFV